VAIPRTRAEAASVLGLAAETAADGINDRHRRLAQLFHPDVNPDVSSASLRMQEINAARELLLGEAASEPTDVEPARGARPRARSRDLSPKAQALDDRISRTMHELPYGVYVIGTAHNDDRNVMVADWMMQVSFKPRLVAVAFEEDATSLANVRGSRAFTVNLLPEDGGMDMASVFLQPKDPSKIGGRGRAIGAMTHDKLDGVPHHTTPDGCPILDEGLAWISCAAEEFFAVGDHVLVTARVVDGAIIGEGDPLTSIYTGWTYSG
jgi:flavin reductase (DIM6/NTAB) family NADH-FMN oxidoreductase RutF